MIRLFVTLCLLLSLQLSLCIQAQTLKVGDKAPAITAQQWLKGEPVPAFKKGHVYLIEFGGVNCPPCRASIPHLSKMAKTYKDKATVISFFIWENDKAGNPADLSYIKRVEWLLGRVGNTMEYTVAVDDPVQTMGDTWMKAAGKNGIPDVFIVDQEGTVAWIGNPIGAEAPLKEIIAGKLNAGAETRRRADKAALYTKIKAATDAGNFRAAVEAIDAHLVTYPEKTDLLQDKVSFLLKAGEEKAAWKLGRQLLEHEYKDQDLLCYYTADYILQQAPALRNPDYNLVIALLERAAQLSKFGTLTGAYYERQADAYLATNDHEGAVKALEKGIEACVKNNYENKGGEEMQERLKQRLLFLSKPEVGKPCPDFTLTHVTHHPTKQVTLSDFKGKWLFLDFWSQTCTSCIGNFPKINKLQSEFKDQAQFMLVGINNKKYNGRIEEVFESLQTRLKWNIVSAYDSVLAQRWGIGSVPHIVIIDPTGIVRYITDGRDMTAEKIKDLLDGKAVSFFVTEIERPDFDANAFTSKESSTNTDGLISRSLLTKWGGESQNGGADIDQWVKWPEEYRKDGYKLAMVNLGWIYTIAYWGKYYYTISDSLYKELWSKPVLEMKDKSLFEFSYDDLTGLYSYNLLLPAAKISRKDVMQYMQQDLERSFGYKASVEVRKMPVWKLVAKPGAGKKLLTKGGKTSTPWDDGKSTAAGFTAKNVAMKMVFMALVEYVDPREEAPFIDETGITGNVDFEINAYLYNMEDTRKELQKQGLDLVKGTRDMKVIVIRDAKNK